MNVVSAEQWDNTGRHVLFLDLPAGQTRGVVWAASIDEPARTRIADSYGGAAYADGWLLSTTAPPRGLIAQAFDAERLMLRGLPQPVRDRVTNATTVGPPGFSAAAGVLLVDRPLPILHQLVWVDRSGRTLSTVGPRATINTFALASDEHRIVAQIIDNDSLKRDFWLFDGGREEGTRLTYDGAMKLRPLWAIDGRHIYFTERTASGLELRTLAVGATVATAVEQFGAFTTFDDVTRDGRYVVFNRRSSETRVPEIWIQGVGNKGDRRVLVQQPFPAIQGRVSPDGRWLAYALELPGGPKIFVQPFDRPGDRIEVSAKGGIGPVWRDDSRELYYEGPDGVMAVPTSEGADVLQIGAPQKLFSLHMQGLISTQLERGQPHVEPECLRQAPCHDHRRRRYPQTRPRRCRDRSARRPTRHV